MAKKSETGIKISHIIKTSVVTAFTIATAFIWKDVIIELIEVVVPAGQELFSKFIAASLATLIVVGLIYLFLQTEYEVEFLMRKIKKPKEEKKVKGVKILKV